VSRDIFNYIEDERQNWSFIRWQGAVKSAIRGKRGQAFLRELADAMDAMPDKRLIDRAANRDGAYCALGVVAAARGIDLVRLNSIMDDMDDHDTKLVADAFGISDALAREIMYANDDSLNWRPETPEQRWQRMREWIGGLIVSSDCAE
jgi:hypothetical protein